MIATLLVLTLRAFTLLEVPHLSRVSLQKGGCGCSALSHVLTAFGDTAGVLSIAVGKIGEDECRSLSSLNLDAPCSKSWFRSIGCMVLLRGWERV